MRPGGTYDAVYAEQVYSSYAQLPLTLFVSVLNACLLAFVLLDVVAGGSVLLWVGLVAALSAARLCVWQVPCRERATRIRARFWAKLGVAGALASGLLWGSSTFLISAGDEPHQLFLALLVAGM